MGQPTYRSGCTFVDIDFTMFAGETRFTNALKGEEIFRDALFGTFDGARIGGTEIDDLFAS